MLRLAALIIALPCLVCAQDWRPMTGEQINVALTDRDVIYENATQRFYASGRTLYNSGQESWGYWTVRGDQYCSQWPPGDQWDCYDLSRSANLIRFIGADGSLTEGTFAP